MNKETRYCSFCGKSENEIKNLIEGDNALICNECIDTCSHMIHSGGTGAEPQAEYDGLPTPAEIVSNLNQHVIGQEQAKKVLAVAVYNHYKRLRHPKEGD